MQSLYKRILLLLTITALPVRLIAADTLQNGVETPYPAPSIEGIERWINSDPLTIESLKGKVVLVDFWTYSCINCIRTLPYITAWDSKYRDKGLTVIGIHSPEFEFEKDSDNVIKALAKYGIRYPVALDNHLATWTSFDNRYWPAHYLINKEGKVVYTHFGEGNYDITENNIRFLLGLPKEQLSQDAVSATRQQTPETYLGYARTQHFAGIPALIHDSAARYALPAELPVNYWALLGKWRVEADKIVSLDTANAIRLNFKAKKVFLVLGSEHNTPIKVTVKLDGIEKNKFTVTNHSLYELLSLKQAGTGTIEISSDTDGLEAFAFTFGD